MDGKWKRMLCTLGNAVLLAGFIILMIGAYYEVVKAGIPYQDPPLELQIQYAINTGIGDELCRIGFFAVLYGVALRLLVWLNTRIRRKS